MSADDMGKPNEAITDKTFEKAAAAFAMSVEETKKEVLKLLKKQLGEN